MSTIRLASCILAMIVLDGCSSEANIDTSRPRDLAVARAPRTPLLDEGRAAYDNYCAGCHGVDGDGLGKAAGFLHPRPRNFQKANFKFSSTRSGQLPTDEDLRRTIVQGLTGSAMPAWNLLPDRTIDALIAYIKTFSPKWQDRGPAPTIPFVEDPYAAMADKSEAVERGEAVYHGFATCWTCHPSYVSKAKINEHLAAMENPTRDAFRPGLFESEVKPNAEGEMIYPPDFTRDRLRAGSDVDVLYRSIAAGITGTAMPTWVDSMSFPDSEGGVLVKTADIWAMAYYVQSLVEQRPARLTMGAFAVRERPVPIALDGSLPEPPAPPEPPPEAEVFIEDE